MMIWVEGAILPDDGLTINAADRTFEHGLGLFETCRTWGGRPTLLEGHKARMLRSADELAIPIDPESLPDADAVRMLLEAEGAEGDRMLRITATGGTTSGRSVVWMRSAPLPAATRDGGAIVCVNAWSLPSSSPLPGGEGGRRGGPPRDFTARHKTLNYWFKRMAFEHARDRGYDETLILADPWGYAEAGRSNLFLAIGDELITPSIEAPIVPGIMRGLILEICQEGPLKAREVRTLGPNRLAEAVEIFLTNAVRGIIPVARVDAPFGTIERPAPGPWTRQLQGLISRRLWPDRGDAR